MIQEALLELEHYLTEASGKIDPEVEDRARHVLEFADERIRAGDQTVIALAGATGSGKSSLFNAISGTPLAAVGARRPTTSNALALSFSATNGPLLNLLRITRRHEARPPTSALNDVVLLDLPDHDSTHLAHREEVDRLVRLVDQFIFVVDPQKYADAALHFRYLRPLAEHRDVISIVLNHADALTDGDPIYLPDDGSLDDRLSRRLRGDLQFDERVARVVEHLRGILHDDGLGEVPIFATNAVTGEGVDLLRHHIGRIATNRRATRERLAADLRNVVDELRLTGSRAGHIQDSEIEELNREVRIASGVQRRAQGVRRAVQRRGAMLQGWRAGGAPEHLELPAHQVSSAADDARTASAVRRFVSESTAALPERWREEARRRILAGPGEQLAPRIDTQMRHVDLSDLESPFGWGLVRVIKWLPIIVLLGFGGWLVYEVVWGSGEFAPKLLTIVGAAFAATLLISFFGDWLLRMSARRAERRTAKRLGEVVRKEVDDVIVAAVRGELAAHQRAESALQRMTGILARG